MMTLNHGLLASIMLFRDAGIFLLFVAHAFLVDLLLAGEKVKHIFSNVGLALYYTPTLTL